jgi:hypothetical protein
MVAALKVACRLSLMGHFGQVRNVGAQPEPASARDLGLERPASRRSAGLALKIPTLIRVPCHRTDVHAAQPGGVWPIEVDHIRRLWHVRAGVAPNEG